MVTREDKIEQSISDYVRDGLAARGYDSSLPLVMRETFPSPEERAQPLTANTVAIGFNFDDGGTPMEMGSDLTMFKHTIEVWVFGMDSPTGRNIAHVVRGILYDNYYTVPLKDIAVDGQPQIDTLIVDKAVVQRQIAGASARPWDQYVFTCTARIEDTYFPSVEV